MNNAICNHKNAPRNGFVCKQCFYGRCFKREQFNKQFLFNFIELCDNADRLSTTLAVDFSLNYLGILRALPFFSLLLCTSFRLLNGIEFH